MFIDRDRVEPAHRIGVHHGDQIHFRRENLTIAKGVAWRDGSGKKHPLTQQAIDKMLEPLPKDSSGTYRALASRWIAGDLVGPFNYKGTRSDDPNDIIPHQNRRELRGLRIFAAWLNHTDDFLRGVEYLQPFHGVGLVSLLRMRIPA